ncbi:hypothetical protein L1047_04050 [Synechococcus sp. Nb3U1]|uniref:hypothetical protein n=1 Tax=Synechococcus sp. Nb3U1 TaxID=1914529 RepID=UPI001F3403A2|nr:hypothetical protein [Synechococcus sp. Nb3U1]MCF2970368.1 hypothetical protein [Synechococcus sp. Nb3U1]
MSTLHVQLPLRNPQAGLGWFPSFTYTDWQQGIGRGLLASVLLLGLGRGDPARAEMPSFALSAEGFTTAADVRPHNRLSLDIAEINGALTAFPPDYSAALQRYAFGRHFNWRDSSHSLAFFADDYQGRMPRTLPGAIALGWDPTFQHQFLTSALMGTGAFSGQNQRRSLSDAARIAAIRSGILATVLNWCRLELTEASIRGPQDNNWSLANGSPKNWSELFAFWYGVEGQHSLHAEMSRISTRFGLPEHPTQRVTQPLAAGQPALLEKRWPEAEATSVQQALDVAALLLFLDRVADLDAAVAAGGDTALAAQWSIRGAWLAAGDTLGRANPEEGKALHETLWAIEEFPNATTLKDAVNQAIDQLSLPREAFGSAI